MKVPVTFSHERNEKNEAHASNFMALLQEIEEQLLSYERAPWIAKGFYYWRWSIRQKRLQQAEYWLLWENTKEPLQKQAEIKSHFVQHCLLFDKKARWPWRWYYRFQYSARKKRAEFLFEKISWLQRHGQKPFPLQTENETTYLKALKVVWHQPLHQHLQQVYAMKSTPTVLSSFPSTAIEALLAQGKILLNMANKENHAYLQDLTFWLTRYNTLLRKNHALIELTPMSLDDLVLYSRLNWLGRLLTEFPLCEKNDEKRAWFALQDQTALSKAELALIALHENGQNGSPEIKNRLALIKEILPLLKTVMSPVTYQNILNEIEKNDDALLTELIAELSIFAVMQQMKSKIHFLQNIPAEPELQKSFFSESATSLAIIQYWIDTYRSAETGTEAARQRDIWIDTEATYLTVWAEYFMQHEFQKIAVGRFDHEGWRNYENSNHFLLQTHRRSAAVEKFRTMHQHLQEGKVMAERIGALLLKAETLMGKSFHREPENFSTETTAFILEMNEWLKEYKRVMQRMEESHELNALKEQLKTAQRMVISQLVERFCSWRVALFNAQIAVTKPWFFALHGADPNFHRLLENNCVVEVLSNRLCHEPSRYVLSQITDLSSGQLQWQLHYFVTPESPGKRIAIEEVAGLSEMLSNHYCLPLLSNSLCEEKLIDYHRRQYKFQRALVFADPISAEYEAVKMMYLDLFTVLKAQGKVMETALDFPKDLSELIRVYNQWYLAYPDEVARANAARSDFSYDSDEILSRIAIADRYDVLCRQYPVLAKRQQEIEKKDAEFEEQHHVWERACKMAMLHLHPDKAFHQEQGTALHRIFDSLEMTFFDVNDHHRLRERTLQVYHQGDFKSLKEGWTLMEALDLATDGHFARWNVKVKIPHARALKSSKIYCEQMMAKRAEAKEGARIERKRAKIAEARTENARREKHSIPLECVSGLAEAQQRSPRVLMHYQNALRYLAETFPSVESMLQATDGWEKFFDRYDEAMRFVRTEQGLPLRPFPFPVASVELPLRVVGPMPMTSPARKDPNFSGARANKGLFGSLEHLRITAASYQASGVKTKRKNNEGNLSHSSILKK
ncbi:MAG: hypothetical protein A3F17_09235 [Gammaproteobacteria bacterium RIFCSPHIGHO2_12_FULL_41_15]|nr:MAG: hypothetical protein A3F17_09235 [Gammaproteobacteria bacterium RIFCSPHIGHO2_12_FULL_41_15]